MNKQVVSIALTVFLLLVLIRIFNVAYPVDIKVTNTSVSSELSVVGDGKVEIKPDTAYIDAGISVSRASTAADAKERMTRVNNAIIAAVKSLGIQASDITTSNFSINPEYDYNISARPAMAPAVDLSATTNVAPDKMIMPENSNSQIVGYTGNATVSIKVKDTTKAAQIIEKVTAAGANNVGSPRFTVDKPEKYREEARNKAIANAKEQAQKLAKQLGIKLGKITNMVEGGGAYPVYDRAYGGAVTMNAEMKSEPPVIEEGTQTVSSTVTLYFERK